MKGCEEVKWRCERERKFENEVEGSSVKMKMKV